MTVSTENNTKHREVLEAIRSRKSRQAEFGYGITTADQYVKQVLAECGNDVGLMRRSFNLSPGDSTEELIRRSADMLAYANPDMKLVSEEMTGTTSGFADLLPDGMQPPEHTQMVFQHVLTTSREDRDKDMLMTEGAILDPKAPLLWQHMQTLPIGKVMATIDHTPDLLKVATVLFDLQNALTDDAAKLIEAEALRISHGFRALEFEQRKQEPGDGGMMPGFRITKFEIMEASLVSVPSNIDAEITLFSNGKLASDFFRSHAKHYLAARPVQVAGHTPAPAGTQMTLKLGDVEIDVKASTADEAISMMKSATQVEPEPAADESVKAEEFLPPYLDIVEEEKGGRVISDKHLNVIKAVHKDLEHMASMDLDRGANAICERCISKLGGVIKAADRNMDDDDSKPKPKPKPGGKPDDDDDKPKAAEEVVVKIGNVITCEEALAILYTTDDMKLLARAKDCIEAMLKVSELDDTSEQYREAVAQLN